MLNIITKIRFDSTALNIREEVSSKISMYEKYDSELQDSQRQPVAQKKRFFARIFANIPQVSTTIMALQLHTLQPLGNISRQQSFVLAKPLWK
jgi:hypothetical protein